MPLVLLGGGGYTVKNVSRCWAYETAIALKTEISNDLPFSDYYDFFSSCDQKLHIEKDNTENKNTIQSLEEIINISFEKLRQITPVPSIHFQEVPPDAIDAIDAIGFPSDPDVRVSQREQDQYVSLSNEFYDDDF